MKSSPPPGLPTWLFILTDLALLGAAAIVAWASPAPLSTGALIAIVGCVLLGVLVGLVPLVDIAPWPSGASSFANAA